MGMFCSARYQHKAGQGLPPRGHGFILGQIGESGQISFNDFLIWSMMNL